MKPSTFERMSKVIDSLEKNNSEVTNILKCSEEFQELGLALTQILSRDIGRQAIIDEMGDAIIRLNLLMRYFDPEKVEERVLFKIEKLEKRMKEKTKKK